MTKCDGYQTARQKNRKHNGSFGDSSINLKPSPLSCSKVTFSATPCLCFCLDTSKKKCWSTLYLAENSTDTPVSGWNLLWKNDENVHWIVSRRCSIENSKNEMKKKHGRVWKTGLSVEFPIITIYDQINYSLTHIESTVSATKYHNTKNILHAIAEMLNARIWTIWLFDACSNT